MDSKELMRIDVIKTYEESYGGVSAVFGVRVRPQTDPITYLKNIYFVAAGYTRELDSYKVEIVEGEVRFYKSEANEYVFWGSSRLVKDEKEELDWQRMYAYAAVYTDED